jgi:hypothetical protein
MFCASTPPHAIHQVMQLLYRLLAARKSNPSGFPMIEYNLLVAEMLGGGWIGLETALDKTVHGAERFDLLRQMLQILVYLLKSGSGLFYEVYKAYANISQTSRSHDQ